MNSAARLLWGAFLICTAAGLVLPFLSSAKWIWWDPLWICILTVAAYTDVAEHVGLATARVSSGISLVTFGLLLLVAAIVQWPFSPGHFTSRPGLLVLDSVPLLLPLFAFGLLVTSEAAARYLLPAANHPSFAFVTSLLFAASIANGMSFLVADREWWTPTSGSPPDIVSVLAGSAAAAFALSLARPLTAPLKSRRAALPGGAAAWFAINLLFLTSNLAMFLAGS